MVQVIHTTVFTVHILNKHDRFRLLDLNNQVLQFLQISGHPQVLLVPCEQSCGYCASKSIKIKPYSSKPDMNSHFNRNKNKAEQNR